LGSLGAMVIRVSSSLGATVALGAIPRIRTRPQNRLG
jgi:hypothetical protein